MERTPRKKKGTKKFGEADKFDEENNITNLSNKHCNCSEKFTELKDILESWRKDQTNQFSKIQSSITVMQNDITAIQKTNSDIEKSLEYLFEEHKEMNTKITNLEGKAISYEHRIKQLEDALEEQLRKSAINSLEIRNVPCKPRETQPELTKITESIFNKISASVNISDILDIRRLSSKTEKRTILVTLNSVILKNKILQAAKTYNMKDKNNKLNASIIIPNSPPELIYIDEHLTPKAKRLYYLGRLLIKEGNIKYCWTSNGRVLLRKKEGDKTVLFSEESQMEEFKMLTADK